MRAQEKQFRYVRSSDTDVSITWRRFGFQPTTDTERRARQPRRGPETRERFENRGSRSEERRVGKECRL